MAKFQGKTRSGKTIKNYRKRSDFILEGQPFGVKVPGDSIEDLDKSLKVFKRQMKDSGRLDELRVRREYIKPSRKFYENRLRAKRKNERAAENQKRMDKEYQSWMIIGEDGKAK